MKSHFVVCAGRELHVRTFGVNSSPALVMWHGLTQSGGVFGPLAEVMAERFWVVCPDTIGRGLSEWATESQDYCFEHYERHALALLEQLGIRRCSWLGTSMGGLLGIRLAGGPLHGAIDKLLLNDIGPEIDTSVLAAAAADRLPDPRFPTFSGFAAYIRGIYERLSHACLSDDGWWEYASALVRRRDDGSFTIHHDPRVTEQHLRGHAEFDHWKEFNQLQCKVGLIYGTDSTILPRALVERMTASRAMDVLAVEGAGHPAFLETPAQRRFIEEFFAAD